MSGVATGLVEEARPGFRQFEALRRSRMFSEVKKPGGPDAGRGPSRPVSTLSGYRLVGVMSGGQGMSYAAVENTATGKQELVGPGDRVGSGTVVEIRPDRVVVQTGGSRAELVLPEDYKRKMEGVLTVRDRGGVTTSGRVTAAGRGTSARPAPARLRPVRDGTAGLEILDPGDMGRKMGLESGDVIVYPDPGTVSRILQTGRFNRPVQFVVRRGAEQIKVNYQPQSPDRARQDDRASTSKRE